MGIELTKNAVNQVEKGTVIYDKNNNLDSVAIILKGRVLAFSEGAKVLMGSGAFLGLSDFYRGQYFNSYIAYEDVTFFCFSLSHKEELDGAFMNSKDYKGLAVFSLVKYINELYGIYRGLHQRVEVLSNFISTSYDNYISISGRLGYAVKTIPAAVDIQPYTSDYVLDEKQFLYYKDFTKMPLDLVKNICDTGNFITLYHIETISNHIIELQDECIDMANYVIDLFPILNNDGDICLYKNYATLAISIEEAGGNNQEMMSAIDSIVDQINVTEKLFEEKIGQTIHVDRKRMEEIYYMLLTKSSNRKEHVTNNFAYTQGEMEAVQTNLKNSLQTILEYSNLSKENKDKFKEAIYNYMNLKDKHSAEDSARHLRKRISEQFYGLYAAVFFAAYGKTEIPKPVELFLKYGFLDETFLNEEQLRELYYLEEPVDETALCPVYNIKDWLTLIYEGKKEPSKNDFDMDYYDTLRDKRKRGDIKEKDEEMLKTDSTQKVLFEIMNMFAYNNRLVNGVISIFVPFLHGENIIRSIKQLYVTSQKMNDALKEILEVDYSLFYRERVYMDMEKGIEKEYIMEEVFPDIILLPTTGCNGIMWQDISGKRKNTKGRFIFPILSEVPVKDNLIKVCGRFRWELCRSIQGTAWNNIKYKSLTSEYADYLQFYRKSRDLTEDAKEKLKSQIQRGRGNYREVFVIDYEVWIKGESTGALRLNRSAREILATYCPFSKAIRERVGKQPLYQEAYGRYTREKLKKIREIEGRYKNLERDHIKLTKELEDTLIFYKEF